MAVLIVTSVLLGWAALWPERACNQPACARDRFALAIEVDAFQPVTPIEFEVSVGGRRISVREILASGGVDATIVPDQLDLPYKATSGPLDRADLHQFAMAWRNRTLPKGVDAGIYALLAPALVSDTGEPLFGIMFDVEERQGIAVAPATTVHRFGEREAQSIPLLQLRTFVHEVLHALNRGHIDAAQMDDGRLTLEAPTRCIASEIEGKWSLNEAPLMAISPATIRYFQTATKAQVLPGTRYSAFQPGRASLTECDEVRSNTAAYPARTRWELARRRLHALLSIRAAQAAEPVSPERESARTQLDLAIQAMPSAYPLGYPVAVRLVVRNLGSEAVPIKGRLNPSYGMVRIEHRRVGDEEWRIVQPLSWFEPIDDEEAMLQPGERTEQTVPIYFGDEGWTFLETGEYEVRARLQTDSEIGDTMSAAVRISIEEAKGIDDRAALRPLLDERGRLDERIGRLLSFGGRIGREEELAPLVAAVEQHGGTALGGALRLTLVTQQLRPPIDPLTGERPAADFNDARELLADTCTDSGIAALKSQLLERHAGSLPDGLRNRAETAATAWDGTTSMRGKTMPTYSDGSLESRGPSLHFCFNESQLRGPTQAAVGRLAKQLRRERPLRIVVVGHGDHAGSCRVNDALGLQRAEAVRHALVQAGVRPRSIEIASLGERRPLDFSSTDLARALNRRVEILVESRNPGAGRSDAIGRVDPQCPGRGRAD